MKRVLDVCCCEGGASRGYSLAGFEVFGADLFDRYARHRYPYHAATGDAVQIVTKLLMGNKLYFYKNNTPTQLLGLEDFDLLAGSPPCQPHSITKYSHDADHEDILEPLRKLFKLSGKPYIIENVPGAPLVEPLTLCGTEFNLVAKDIDGSGLFLRRHRLFESNLELKGNGGCACDKFRKLGLKAAGVYGGGSGNRTHAETVRRGGYTPSKAIREKLMGIDWMSQDGLSQAIPPAYTKHLGAQVLEQLSEEAA